MSFTYKQVSEGRWGIFSGSKLLATVSDRATCETILANFSSGRRDVPAHTPDKIYQADQIDHKRASLEAAHQASTHQASSSEETTAGVVAKSADASLKPVGQTVSSVAAGAASPSPTTTVEKAAQMSDAELARVLNTQSLKVNELESAVLQAQRGQHS